MCLKQQQLSTVAEATTEVKAYFLFCRRYGPRWREEDGTGNCPKGWGHPIVPGSTGHGRVSREETGVPSSSIRNHWKERGLLHTNVDKGRDQNMPKRK